MTTYILLDNNNNAIGYDTFPDGIKPAGNFREATQDDDLEKIKIKQIEKSQVRKNIEQKVGDDKDLIKLVNMRVAMLERLVLVLAGNTFSIDIPQDLKDKAQALTQTYINMYVTGQAKDTIDLADYAQQLNELINANNTICDEVEEYRNKIQ